MKLNLDARGCREVTAAELPSVHTPPSTETFRPVPHAEFYDLVYRRLPKYGVVINSARFATMRGDRRFFALLEVNHEDRPDSMCVGGIDYELVVGLVHGLDRQARARIGIGSKVVICENYSMDSDMVIARKHTKNVLLDLDDMIEKVLRRLPRMAERMDRNIMSLYRHNLTEQEADHIMITAVRDRAFPASLIGDVANEWRTPKHTEFRDRTAWSLLNAFTQINQKRRCGAAALSGVYSLERWLLGTLGRN